MWKFLDSMHVRRATAVEGLGSFVAMVFSIPGYVAGAVGMVAAVLAYLDGQPRLAIAAAFLAFALSAAIVLLIIAMAVERFWRAAAGPSRASPKLAADDDPSPNSSARLTEVSEQLQNLKERLEGLAKVWVSSNLTMSEGGDLIRSEVAEMSNRLAKIETSLRPKGGGILAGVSDGAGETRLDAIEAKIQETWNYTSTVDANHNRQQLNIVASLRARDALEILGKADAVVMDLGPKLIAADSYVNAAAWSWDHNEWGFNLLRIDDLLKWWQKDYHEPFLHLRHSDYEREDRNAPAKIVDEEHKNFLRYKQVCIAHDRYVYKRDYMFTYFKNKASDLP